jgi:pimeloyl-ACP methyl ester carboxylesterase
LPVMNDDINAVRSVILDQLGNGNVVVVGHSYGTIVATAAVARLGRDERKANGNSTHVQHILFISGILVPRTPRCWH